MRRTMNTQEAVEHIIREQQRLMLVCATMATDLDREGTNAEHRKDYDELQEDLKLHQAMGVMLTNTTKLLTIQNNPFIQTGGQ